MCHLIVALRHFNPRSSCEERPTRTGLSKTLSDFNPRSSCEERRAIDCNVCNDITIFQSTLLMRGATAMYLDGEPITSISIHAPHARSDAISSPGIVYQIRNFNPRSSCEERLGTVRDEQGYFSISIHAPHARSDKLFFLSTSCISPFQSTLLMRGATLQAAACCQRP